MSQVTHRKGQMTRSSDDHLELVRPLHVLERLQPPACRLARDAKIQRPAHRHHGNAYFVPGVFVEALFTSSLWRHRHDGHDPSIAKRAKRTFRRCRASTAEQQGRTRTH